MRSTVAGIVALVASWISARLIGHIGKRPELWAPFWEEFWKTSLTRLFLGQLILVHIIFGLGEALFENLRRRDPVLFAVNVLCHTVFGLVAWFVLPYGWWAAGMAGLTVHFLWNAAVLHYTRCKTR